MLQRPYKDTDQMISALGMGCMRLPTKRKLGRDVIDEATAMEMVDYAYHHGVNYFDTAYMYHDGKSEAFMGRALARYDRSTLYIATKLPIWMAKTPADMARIFNEQLRNLQTDYFDFYLLHSLNRDHYKRCKEFDAYAFLDEMRKAGKIRKLGFSFHDSPEMLREIVADETWDFAQIQLNYLDWTEQNAKAQYEILEANGIPCVVMEPVRGGALANPCPQANALFKAARPDKSVASWAIRYAESLPNVLTVLSGMSSMEQLKDNIETVSNFEPIDAADAKVIADALEAYRNRDRVPCTGCRYCMDCPSGVQIPETFKLFNETYAVEKNKERFLAAYTALPEKNRPTACVRCGVCASHCPQSIAIPDRLHEITELADRLQKE